MSTRTENQLTDLDTRKGYPHLLTKKGNVIRLVHSEKVIVGDGFTFGAYYQNVDKKNVTVYIVSSIKEERQAEGHHKAKEATYYELECTPKVMDISNSELLVSTKD